MSDHLVVYGNGLEDVCDCPRLRDHEANRAGRASRDAEVAALEHDISELSADVWLLREAQAEAWDEGHAQGVDDVDTSGYGGITASVNPYRSGTTTEGSE